MEFKKIKAPSVDIEQIQVTQSVTVNSPTLAPFIFGVCREVVNAVDDTTGGWNSAAKYLSYTQLPQNISYTSFPSPRANIDQVTVEDAYVRVFHDFASQVNELSKTSNFLVSWNKATQPVIRTDVVPADGWDLNPNGGATTLVLVQDQTVPSLTNQDIAVTFTSIANAKLTNAEAISQINTAYGKTVCRAVTLTGDARARIEFFGSFGAGGSITVRGGGTANSIFGVNASTERVEGAGFRAQDIANGTSKSTWIEWYRGGYFLAGNSASLPVGSKYGFITEAGSFVNAIAANVTYNGSGIDMRVGDEFWADGVRVKDATITKVEAARFRLGILNTVLSTFDSAGKLINPVYDNVAVALMTDATPFAPRYVWFKANNLTDTGTPTAAILTGSNTASAALPAIVESASINGPFSLTGLYLDFEVTDDDVVTSTRFIFSGAAADVAGVAVAIGGAVAGVVFSNNGGKLHAETVKTNSHQSIKVLKTGSANTLLGFSTVSDTVGTGTDPLFISKAASVTTSGNTFPITLANNNTLVVKLSTDGGATFPTTRTHTSAGASYNDIDALVAALSGDAGFTNGNLFTIAKVGDELKLATAAVGEANVIKIDAASTAISPTKIAYTSNQTGRGVTALTGLPFRFRLNHRAKVYEVVPQTNSLLDLIKIVNDAVGYTIAKGTTALVLTSTIKGYASLLEVLQDSGLSAARTLGFLPSNDSATGSGRPLPELVVNALTDVASLDGELLRNTLTGDPFDPSTSNLYIQYRGIRKDVSPLAKTVDGQISPVRIGNETELKAALSPISRENPLALAIWFALKDSPNSYIYCMGVDEISSEYPDGTPAAYERILNAVESQELYTMHPLTDNEEVLQAVVTNTIKLNDPESGTERITFITTRNPTRAVSTLIGSGVGGGTLLGNTNAYVLDVNINSALVQAGINTAQPIPLSANLYLTIKVAGKVRNYNISNVNGTVLTLKSSFTSTENTDSFYTTTALTEALTDNQWSVFIRGGLLLIPGTTLPDKQKIAENIYLKIQNQFNPFLNEKYWGRCVYHMVADSVIATLPDGSIEQIPTYYAGANYAGLIATLAPQQPLTRFKITGYQNVTGTSGYFTKDQLDLIAGGGGFILVNDGNGKPIYCRQQVSTDTSTIESRELSINNSLSFLKKLIRMRYAPYVGNRNITDQTLADLGVQNVAIEKYVVETLKAFKSVSFGKIVQDKAEPDKVWIDILCQPFYPLNRVKVRVYF